MSTQVLTNKHGISDIAKVIELESHRELDSHVNTESLHFGPNASSCGGIVNRGYSQKFTGNSIASATQIPDLFGDMQIVARITPAKNSNSMLALKDGSVSLFSVFDKDPETISSVFSRVNQWREKEAAKLSDNGLQRSRPRALVADNVRVLMPIDTQMGEVNALVILVNLTNRVQALALRAEIAKRNAAGKPATWNDLLKHANSSPANKTLETHGMTIIGGLLRQLNLKDYKMDTSINKTVGLIREGNDVWLHVHSGPGISPKGSAQVICDAGLKSPCVIGQFDDENPTQLDCKDDTVLDFPEDLSASKKKYTAAFCLQDYASPNSFQMCGDAAILEAWKPCTRTDARNYRKWGKNSTKARPILGLAQIS
jgi:hypothetical protein